MAIAFIASATAATAGATTSLACDVPSGTLDGHVMVATIQTRPSAIAGAIVPPAGWTEQTFRDTGAHNHRIYTRTASSEPANYTWSIAVGSSIAIGISSWSGVDASAPVHGAATSEDLGNDTTIGSIGITTLTPNAVVITSYAVNESASPTRIPLTPHASTTKRAETNSTVGGIGMGICQVSESRPTPGATGARDATTAGGNSSNTALMIVLREDGAVSLLPPGSLSMMGIGT